MNLLLILDTSLNIYYINMFKRTIQGKIDKS